MVKQTVNRGTGGDWNKELFHQAQEPDQQGKQENSEKNSGIDTHRHAQVDIVIGDVEDFKEKYSEAAFNQEEERIAQAFIGSIRAARDNGTEISGTEIIEAFWELAYGGRLGEAFQQAIEVSKYPPVKLPNGIVPWDREFESPPKAIRRIYKHFIDGKRMHLGVVRSTALELYDEFNSWKRGKKNWAAFEGETGMTRAEFDKAVPKQSVFNDRKLEEPLPMDAGERHRIFQLRRDRELKAS